MWREFFTYGLNQSLTAGNGTVFQPNNIRLDSDADFEAHKLTYNATSGNVRTRLRTDQGLYLMKQEVNLRNIAGNFAGTPFIFPRPHAFVAGSNLIVESADRSGGANTLRWTFMGAKIRQGTAPWDRRYRAVRPFTYSVEETRVAANQTASLRIEIDTDSHFLVQKITGTKEGNCLVEFKEGGRDLDWQNTPLHFETIVGNGQFPNVLFANRFVRRGLVLVIQIQDLSGLSNLVEIALHGVKMYE